MSQPLGKAMQEDYTNMPIDKNKFWILDNKGQSIEVENLEVALKKSRNGYYALCDYSFQPNGTENCYGNLWYIEKGDIRKLLKSFLNVVTESDEKLAESFHHECCFAYWKILPTTEESFLKFIEFQRKPKKPFLTMSYIQAHNYALIE